jgi:HlyD family secretion protein
MKARLLWIMGGVVLVAAIVLFVMRGPLALASGRAADAAPETARVTTVTAITAVEASGTVAPRQSATLTWKTGGTVATVAAAVGDVVRAGDVLMTIDMTSAPANVLQAQSELTAAQKALKELSEPPSALRLAQAEQSVIEARDHLARVERELRSVANPVGQHLYDAVANAELALQTAQANEQLANVSSDVQQYHQARVNADLAFQRYQDLQARYDESNDNQELLSAARQAQAAYQAAQDQVAVLELRIGTDQANKAASAQDAQARYDTAVANLNAAQRGPDALQLSLAEARLAVAEASLADAEQNLADLQRGPHDDDIAAAEVRIQIARQTLDSVVLTAPFDGQILAVNYRPGDQAAQGGAAVVLADRSHLHVNVSVDEAEVSLVAPGQPVTLTIDALGGLTAPGQVAQVNGYGETVQGLVRYTVRVDLAQPDPRLLLNMTAYARIVTAVQEDALAVPVRAIQYDSQGEYVLRVSGDGSLERVLVTSGQIEGDVIAVRGDLRPGDTLQVEAAPTTVRRGFMFGR